MVSVLVSICGSLNEVRDLDLAVCRVGVPSRVGWNGGFVWLDGAALTYCGVWGLGFTRYEVCGSWRRCRRLVVERGALIAGNVWRYPTDLCL